MTITPITEEISKSSQEYVADKLGVTQGAIWQAIQKNRNLFIINDDGNFSAFEIKPVFKTKPNLTNVKPIKENKQ